MDQMTNAPGQQAPLDPAPPWGFWGTLAWGVLVFIAWFVTQTIVVVGLVVWQETIERGSTDLQKMMNDGFALAVVTIVASPVWIGIAAIAVRWRRWRVRDYLALVAPRRRELVFSIALLAAVLVAFDLLTYALGREIIPRFMIEAYTSAKTPAAVALLFIAIVVVAPVCEEIAFRGFLFRGWSESWLGVSGALVLTSGAWALMHVQYDWFVIGQIFLLGLLFGWLRWASGSTLLTIILHVIANFTAFAQTVVKVEWLSS
jgi:CAAX protease family protein